MPAVTTPAVSAAPILELIEGFRRSKTMFAAVALGIFDGERPNGAAIESLLEACVALGLLEKSGARYVNSAVADVYLRRDSPNSLAGYARYSNDALYRLWGHLEDAVIQGTNRWHDVFGECSEAVRQATYSGPDFCSGMHGLGLLSSSVIVNMLDLSAFTHLVDLGGASGHFASAAKARYPTLRATVIDYSHVIEHSRPYVADGVEMTGGDFCTMALPSADLFVLGRILHHRSETRGRDLLVRLYDRLAEGGGVLVVERFLEPGGALDAHMSSLNMLLCTDQGRERSCEEYESMLCDAGFTVTSRCSTHCTLDAILAIRKPLRK
jgi:acetylserotonin O-methyltransferase